MHTHTAKLEEQDDAKSKQIDALTSENVRFASQHAQLTQELTAAIRLADDAEQRLAALSNASQHNVGLSERRRSSEAATAARRIDELGRQVDELTQQLHASRTALAQAEQNSVVANQVASEASARVTSMSLAHEALRLQFEQLQADRQQQLEQQRATHEQTLLSMQQQLDHAAAELQQIDRLRQERQQLTTQLRELQQQKTVKKKNKCLV